MNVPGGGGGGGLNSGSLFPFHSAEDQVFTLKKKEHFFVLV